MESSEIKVKIIEYRTKRYYYMQYVNPETGRRVTRSTKVEKGGKRQRRKAERMAGVWEDELRSSTYQEPSRVTWKDFRMRYFEDVLIGLAEGTEEKASAVFNSFERCVRPQRLHNITSRRMSYYVTQLRRKGSAEATIHGHLRHLKAALRWAHTQGLLQRMPAIDMPKRTGKAKGRPVTTEEFERMLAVVADVVGMARRDTWVFFLEGLWLSGLRLTEALALQWDDPFRVHVDYQGKHPMLVIPSDADKGGEDRRLPLTPDFAEFLEAVPIERRTGCVFHPLGGSGKRLNNRHWVGKVVSKIGEKAGVVVARTQGDRGRKTGGRVKYASAHDLRRSFGTRWSRRVSAPELQMLMRHTTIQTTMTYYVHHDAESVTADLWKKHEVAKITVAGGE